MNEAAIQKKLHELCETMTDLPTAKKPTASPVADGIYCPQPVVGADAPIEDALDQLRLQVKYLLFDLEATRRENRYLRQMLDNRRRSNEQEGDNGPKF